MLSLSSVDHLERSYKNLNVLGVGYMSHGRIGLDGTWCGYFSNKSWEKIYRDHRFHLYEPLIEVLLTTTKPVFFWNMANLDDKEGITKYRSQTCQIVKGLSLMMDTDEGKSFLSLGFSSNHVDCFKFFVAHKKQIISLFERL